MLGRSKHSKAQLDETTLHDDEKPREGKNPSKEERSSDSGKARGKKASRSGKTRKSSKDADKQQEPKKEEPAKQGKNSSKKRNGKDKEKASKDKPKMSLKERLQFWKRKPTIMAPRTPEKTPAFGVVCFVLSFVAAAICWASLINVIGIVFGIVSIVFGILAIKRSFSGRGGGVKLSCAGIAISIAALVVASIIDAGTLGVIQDYENREPGIIENTVYTFVGDEVTNEEVYARDQQWYRIKNNMTKDEFDALMNGDYDALENMNSEFAPSKASNNSNSDKITTEELRKYLNEHIPDSYENADFGIKVELGENMSFASEEALQEVAASDDESVSGLSDLQAAVYGPNDSTLMISVSDASVYEGMTTPSEIIETSYAVIEMMYGGGTEETTDQTVLPYAVGEIDFMGQKTPCLFGLTADSSGEPLYSTQVFLFSKDGSKVAQIVGMGKTNDDVVTMLNAVKPL